MCTILHKGNGSGRFQFLQLFLTPKVCGKWGPPVEAPLNLNYHCKYLQCKKSIHIEKLSIRVAQPLQQCSEHGRWSRRGLKTLKYRDRSILLYSYQWWESSKAPAIKKDYRAETNNRGTIRSTHYYYFDLLINSAGWKNFQN